MSLFSEEAWPGLGLYWYLARGREAVAICGESQAQVCPGDQGPLVRVRARLRVEEQSRREKGLSEALADAGPWSKQRMKYLFTAGAKQRPPRRRNKKRCQVDLPFCKNTIPKRGCFPFNTEATPVFCRGVMFYLESWKVKDEAGVTPSSP